MIIYFSSFFKRKYKKLPARAQNSFKKAFLKFEKDPFEPSLKTHKLKNLHGLWSFRINYSERVLFRFVDKNEIELLNIGNHDIYK